MQKLSIENLREYLVHNKFLVNELLSNPAGADVEILADYGLKLMKEIKDAFKCMSEEEKDKLRAHRDFMPLIEELIEMTTVLSAGFDKREYLLKQQ